MCSCHRPYSQHVSFHSMTTAQAKWMRLSWLLFECSKNLHGSGLLAQIFRRSILRLLTNVKIRSGSKTKASRLSPSLPPLDVTCSVLAIQNVNLPFYFWPIRLSIQLVPISKHTSDNILTHVLTCTWLRYHVNFGLFSCAFFLGFKILDEFHRAKDQNLNCRFS